MKVIAWMARNRDTPRLFLVLILAMATLGLHVPPTVAFDQPDDSRTFILAASIAKPRTAAGRHFLHYVSQRVRQTRAPLHAG